MGERGAENPHRGRGVEPGGGVGNFAGKVRRDPCAVDGAVLQGEAAVEEERPDCVAERGAVEAAVGGLAAEDVVYQGV